jgi:hypothetical protein
MVEAVLNAFYQELPLSRLLERHMEHIFGLAAAAVFLVQPAMHQVTAELVEEALVQTVLMEQLVSVVSVV